VAAPGPHHQGSSRTPPRLPAGQDQASPGNTGRQPLHATPYRSRSTRRPAVPTPDISKPKLPLPPQACRVLLAYIRAIRSCATSTLSVANRVGTSGDQAALTPVAAPQLEPRCISTTSSPTLAPGEADEATGCPSGAHLNLQSWLPPQVVVISRHCSSSARAGRRGRPEAFNPAAPWAVLRDAPSSTGSSPDQTKLRSHRSQLDLALLRPADQHPERHRRSGPHQGQEGGATT